MATENVHSENSASSKNDEDECGICLTAYKSPRILPCKHIFCRLCLIKLADKKQGADSAEELVPLTCPLCRIEVNLLIGEVDELPMYLKDDDEDDYDNAGDEDVNDVDEDHRDLCVVCENSVPAEYECFQCQKVLCGSCKKIHDNLLKHDVQDLQLDLSQDKCLKHPEVKLGYSCLDCSRILCKECVKSEHSLHQTQTLKSYLMEIDGELKNYSSNIKQILEELEKACRSTNIKHHEDKTLLGRINCMGKKIKSSKKRNIFYQNLMSEIHKLRTEITTHKTRNVEMFNNEIGIIDFQIGRLFKCQFKGDYNELKFFFGNVNWTLSVLRQSFDPDSLLVSLTPYTKSHDTLIKSITTTITLSVERSDLTTVIKFSEVVLSQENSFARYFMDNNKSAFCVNAFFQKTNIEVK